MSGLPSVFKTPEERDRLMTLLTELGVASVEVSFSGGGDSGAIDQVVFFSSTPRADCPSLFVELKVGDATFEDAPYTTQAWNDMTRQWEITEGLALVPLREYVEHLCYEALDRCGLDWYNNDGGQGTFTLKFMDDGAPEITLDVGVNYTSTEDYTFSMEL
jgi:hypothetical protein